MSVDYVALVKSRESVPEWIAFVDYFNAANGFSPTPGDLRVEELFNYYLVGAWDKISGRHQKAPSDPKGPKSSSATGVSVSKSVPKTFQDVKRVMQGG